MRTVCDSDLRQIPGPLGERVRRMAAAAAQWLDPEWAGEVARNVATPANIDETDGIPCDVAEIATDAIRHRMRHWGMTCSDPAACGLAMARAWRMSEPMAAELNASPAPQYACA